MKFLKKSKTWIKQLSGIEELKENTFDDFAKKGKPVYGKRIYAVTFKKAVSFVPEKLIPLFPLDKYFMRVSVYIKKKDIKKYKSEPGFGIKRRFFGSEKEKVAYLKTLFSDNSHAHKKYMPGYFKKIFKGAAEELRKHKYIAFEKNGAIDGFLIISKAKAATTGERLSGISHVFINRELPKKERRAIGGAFMNWLKTADPKATAIAGGIDFGNIPSQKFGLNFGFKLKTIYAFGPAKRGFSKKDFLSSMFVSKMKKV